MAAIMEDKALKRYERPDLEGNSPGGVAIGQCQHCKGDIMEIKY